ncbi:MAG: peptidoglycan DD-metalloendopeptidase family protein [Diaphorobacter nitroreducens]|uniref:M23 family metallopeptidase n=1 Tax=Diaphorobacter TaxID=238749 RepID=UPI0000DCB759|nr:MULTISPECIES: M23 family metallopeptidase [Diaphorobacter]ABM40877.1 peptidase M23B [Acidovorax sp. JS42]UOB05147.1 M23 family metallopeptidase [Diaphorobacter sp. LI3]ASI69157.1 peptidase M23 [Diaphorobacter nitroreducens]MBV2218431.1 M23 family metallopeptidase [Diaphorobacter sp.]POR09316.1 peptidase M23 [Diaphorobacter sp. LR2014-1]
MNNGLTTACLVLLNQLKQSVQKHPKRITAAVATLLLTGGGGAFAVASFAPDPADLPVRTVTQAVQSLAADEPLSSLVDIPQYALYRSDVTRSADTAESILQRLGVADPAASAFLRSDANVRQNLLGRTGRSMSAETTDDHRLTRLTARWAPDDSGSFKRLVVERQQDGSFASRIETAPLTVGSRLAGGIIRSSLFAATDAANIPDAVAVQLAEVFSGDIDFRRALRKEDRFSVVYETLEADGEPLRSGRVLSAEFHNGDKTHSAVWFQEPGATKGSYYTLDGESMRRAYLSSPVEFSRVSSGFAMRFHPIHKTWRAHLGTDFAAPTGTSVRTVGDGVVDFAGVQNGYGNVVYIKHRNQHVTVYAHLSRIDVRKGESVEQGQKIGAVGSTGWATGPHLHFEFRVAGEHKDPMVIARQSEAAQPVSAAARPAFDRLAGNMRVQLSSAAQILQASAE